MVASGAIASLKVETPVVVIDPGDAGPTLARSLGRLGVTVHGIHGDSESPGTRSRYWSHKYVWDIRKENAGASVDFLLQLGGSIGGRPILIPADDAGLLLVGDHAQELRRVFRFPDQPAGLARALSSKQEMYTLCKRHGIPTPETAFPQSPADVHSFLETAVFPVMLKGIFTYALGDRSGVRMMMCDGPEMLLEWYERLETPARPNLMLQEYIPAPAEANWMFNGYFDSESNCLFGVAGQKLRQYPAYRGATSLGVCTPNPDLVKQVTDFMKLLGYRGILDIGYRYDARSNQYKLLDVNPRIGMTFRLFVDSLGADVARVQYADLTGQKISTGLVRPGRRWLVENRDAVSAFRYVKDGHANLVSWLGSYWGVRELCWLALDDPKPFLSMCRKGIVQCTDALSTVPPPVPEAAL